MRGKQVDRSHDIGLNFWHKGVLTNCFAQFWVSLTLWTSVTFGWIILWFYKWLNKAMQCNENFVSDQLSNCQSFVIHVSNFLLRTRIVYSDWCLLRPSRLENCTTNCCQWVNKETIELTSLLEGIDRFFRDLDKFCRSQRRTFVKLIF